MAFVVQNRLLIQVFLAGTWLAGCAGGQTESSDGLTTVVTATGPETSESTASDTDGETTDAESTDADTTDTADTGAQTTAEPVDCGMYTQCGVLCVDLESDPENCGVCGVSCIVPNALATCVGGSCALGDCDPGYADCDADINNGCETMLSEGEECPLVCDPNTPEACNLFDDNCNESCDEAVEGCRHGVHRSSSPTLGHFYTTDLAEASSGDFTLESENYFYMYSQAQAGVVPLYRCLLGNGKRFYTTSGSCEGAGQSEGVLGHLAGEVTCGATPLFRLYHSMRGHFYTTSAGERDNAVDNLGYKFESTIGYVWTSP